jgi:hypothetical protein
VISQNVVVLGMHRSGTSAITRVINLLGPSLGRSEDLFSAPDNPGGHWESNSLCLCNDLILSQFHGNFLFPPRLRPGWHESRAADALLPQIGRAFSDVYRTENWVWKDPRLALTLPIWRRVLPNFSVVLVIRNPSSVASSLERRDALPLAYCHALWDRYNRSAVAVVSGLDVAILNFDDMIADPVREVSRLAQNLKNFGVQISGDIQDATNSLELDLVHGRRSTRADHLTRGLWQQMQDLPKASVEFEGSRLSSGPLWVDAAIYSARMWSRRWWAP